jgi:hypothetical protein
MWLPVGIQVAHHDDASEDIRYCQLVRIELGGDAGAKVRQGIDWPHGSSTVSFLASWTDATVVCLIQSRRYED